MYSVNAHSFTPHLREYIHCKYVQKFTQSRVLRESAQLHAANVHNLILHIPLGRTVSLSVSSEGARINPSKIFIRSLL
jgi:hypothetical protein